MKGNEPICHPRWISESLAAGKLLDFRNYLLYSALNTNQPKIDFGKARKSVDGSSGQALDANSSNFLGEFYNNSRLHHISTLGADFKRYTSQLRDRHDAEVGFPAREDLKRCFGCPEAEFVPFRKNRVLMHIDMDCFFVSVGLRKRPDLVGKPVAVAHAKGARYSKIIFNSFCLWHGS